MSDNGPLARPVLGVLTLCFLSASLTGCVASAAVTVASQTVKTTAKAAGTAARVTLDGTRAVSHTVTRPLRKDSATDAPEG